MQRTALEKHHNAQHEGRYFSLAGWRPAWINDLQREGLESGVFIGSPGSPLVEPALARLSAR
jgi:hypothetical protein